MFKPASLKNKIAIVGVGESDIGRVPHMTGLGLNAQACKRALDDAGLKPDQIDGLLTGYSFTEPYFMLGTVLCEYLGMKPTYNASLVVGGATPAIMLKRAAEAIVAGQAETVLVCAGENRATGASRDSTLSTLLAVGHPYFEQPYGGSIPGYYAMIARRYMEVYGTTREEMASVCVNTRNHALMHPNAHMKKPITMEDVLNAKPIADPLGMLDCCLISDAGGAFIVTSAERAKDITDEPIYLQGIGEYHTHEHIMCAPSLTEFGAEVSGRIAYEMADLSPQDVDVAELYDCFSIVPILEAEELGLMPRGEGGRFFLEGHAAVGGKLPINTHGGMLSHAHAGAAGGLLAMIEGVRQLRGGLGARQVEDAKVALVHNEGGILSSHCTMLFANEQL